MRSVLISTCVLAGLAPIQAEILSFSFSGTWGSNLGVVTAGQTFSGTGEWDPSTIGAVVANFAELTSYSFTMTPADGFNVPGPLPKAQILFAGAGYNTSNFRGFQVNERSTSDNQIYTFFFRVAGGASNAAFSLGSQADFASNYQNSGQPAVVPEPRKTALAVFGLWLFVLAAHHALRHSVCWRW